MHGILTIERRATIGGFQDIPEITAATITASFDEVVAVIREFIEDERTIDVFFDED